MGTIEQNIAKIKEEREREERERVDNQISFLKEEITNLKDRIRALERIMGIQRG